MNVRQPAEVAAFIRGKRNPLLVAGYLCHSIDLDGVSLLDYAAALARKLNAPVAATGNAAPGLRARGVDRAKKMWMLELMNYMRDPWRSQYMQRDMPRLESLMEHRPDVLVLLGYDARVTDWFVSALKDIDTVALTPTPAAGATCTLPRTSSLGQWRRNLDELIAAL